MSGHHPATNRPPGTTRPRLIPGTRMPGPPRTRSRPTGRVRRLPRRAVRLPVIFLLNGRCGGLAQPNPLTGGAVPDRGWPAAGRAEAIPGTPGPRTADNAAVTSPARLRRGAGALRAALIAGRPRPSRGRRPACPGAARRATGRGRGTGRVAWPPRRATRRATVTCPRRPARRCCGQSPGPGGQSHETGGQSQETGGRRPPADGPGHRPGGQNQVAGGRRPLVAGRSHWVGGRSRRLGGRNGRLGRCPGERRAAEVAGTLAPRTATIRIRRPRPRGTAAPWTPSRAARAAGPPGRPAASRDSSTPAPGTSSRPMCCAAGGTARKRSPGPARRAVPGQRRVPDRLRLPRSTVSPGPAPRTGTG
jgi:hypothetical protein